MINCYRIRRIRNGFRLSEYRMIGQQQCQVTHEILDEEIYRFGMTEVLQIAKGQIEKAFKTGIEPFLKDLLIKECFT